MTKEKINFTSFLQKSIQFHIFKILLENNEIAIQSSIYEKLLKIITIIVVCKTLDLLSLYYLDQD